MRNRKCILSFLAWALIITIGSVFALSSEDRQVQNRIIINADLGKDTINKNIYGHFSEHLGRCIYDGYWAGESSPVKNVRGIRSDIVEALRKIKIPVLRWPGGCFADEYHWKDGIGPRDKRPTMINTASNWDVNPIYAGMSAVARSVKCRNGSSTSLSTGRVRWLTFGGRTAGKSRGN